MDIVEKVAKSIYATDCSYLMKEDRAWRIDGLAWDKFSDHELCEWERDEYRTRARVAIDTIFYEIHEGELE